MKEVGNGAANETRARRRRNALDDEPNVPHGAVTAIEASQGPYETLT